MQAPETLTEPGEKPKKRAKRKHHDHARDGISIEDVWKTCERRSGKRFLARVRASRLSPESIDAIERQVQSRKLSPARAAKL